MLSFALSQAPLSELRTQFLEPQYSVQEHLEAFNQIKNLSYPEKFSDLDKAMSLYSKSVITDAIKIFILEAFSNPEKVYLSKSEAVKLIEYAYHLYYFGIEEIIYLRQAFLFELNSTPSFGDSEQRIFIHLLGYMSADFKLQEYRGVVQRLQEIAMQEIAMNESNEDDFMMRYSAIESIGKTIATYKNEKIWIEEMNQWLRNTYRFRETSPIVKMRIIIEISRTKCTQNRAFLEVELKKTTSSIVKDEIQRALKEYDS